MDIKKDLCIKIKNDIINLNQNEIEEIFKIIYKNNSTYTKNNNGIFINLNWLNEDTLINIDNYINFCIKSHTEIDKYENICNILNDSINNKDKNDEIIDDNINSKIIDKNATNLISKQKISSSMKFYLLKKKFLKQNNINNNLNENILTHEEYITPTEKINGTKLL